MTPKEHHPHLLRTSGTADSNYAENLYAVVGGLFVSTAAPRPLANAMDEELL